MIMTTRRAVGTTSVVGATIALAFLTGCSNREATPGGAHGGSIGSPSEGLTEAPPSTLRGMELVDRARKQFPGVLTPPDVDRMTTTGDSFTVLADAPRSQPSHTGVKLPAVADGALVVDSLGVTVSVRPQGFAPSAVEWSEHLAVYPSVQPGVHAFRRVAWDGVEDFYQVESPKEQLSFSYDVALTHVAGLRLVDGTLEALDAAGTPRLRSTHPVAIDAHGVRRVGELTVTGCKVDVDPRGPWNRPVTAPGASSCVVSAKIDGRGLAYPVLVDPAWIGTYSTKQQHAYHKMFLLPAGATDAGKVILVGGTGTAPSVTELFDPGTNSWASSTPLPDSNGFGVGTNAAMLSDGTVVLAGGFPTSGTTSTARATVLVRKKDGTWGFGAAMSSGRAYHTMTVVKKAGKEFVLVAGGQTTSFASTSTPALKTAELYDLAVDGWLGAGAMGNPHTKGAATVLTDGRALIVGGDSFSSGTTCCSPSTSTEIFDPTSSLWTTGPAMNVAREGPLVMALTGTNAAVVIGGLNTTSFALNSLETLNAGATTWTTLPGTMVAGRQFAAADRLSDGRILITGGNASATSSVTQSPTDTADLYDPATGTVTSTATMGSPRMFHASVSFGAKVLVTGGLTSSSSGTETTSSEIFDTSVGKACTTPASCPTGFSCSDGVCCSAAAGCPEGQKCNAPGHEGICTKPQGAACTANPECATGFCVGGFCCESACNGGCKSCGNAGKEGTCVLALAGTDPGGFCGSTGGGDVTCGKKCDGTGKCTVSYAPAGTPCGASAVDAGADSSAPFCNVFACAGWGPYCQSTPNMCGLTCTSSVTCSEATHTCTASATGIHAGFCVIDSTCFTYGDINPKDATKCQICDPPTSKTTWSTADACKEAGVDTGVDAGDDTGAPDDSATIDSGTVDSTVDDTAVDDTAPSDDTGVAVDSNVPSPGNTDLPAGSACGCRVPGNDAPAGGVGALAAFGLAALVLARRRKNS